MTREIKFRGKTKPDSRWVFGYYVKMENETKTIQHHAIMDVADTDNKFIKSGKDYQMSLSVVDSNTIGQFTGLHDKNGKEIYEGDIIAANGKQIGYIVGGVRGYCYDVIYNPAKSNGEKAWPLYSVVTRDYPNKCEVIGNIYDNPELLKQK